MMTKKRILSILFLVLFLVCLFSGCSSMKPATDSPLVSIDGTRAMSVDTDAGLLTVRYFLLHSDEKSGDSILLHTPDDKFYLIDAGRPECGKQVVEDLQKLGVTRLEAVFNTHPHVDHLGGMPDVIGAFPIGVFYRNPYEYTDSEYYNKLIDALHAKNVPTEVISEGSALDLGGGLTVNVYNPPADMDPEVEYPKLTAAGKLNQRSLSLLFQYKEVKLLFSGDLYKPGEKNMLARYPEGTFKADVVHATHHGADTSSDLSYIKATSPTFAVMSSNGLQAKKTYQNYEKNGAVVLSTALNGDLCITTDGTKESLHAYVSQQVPPSMGRPAKG